MKKIVLFIATLAFANFARAAERITIEPAHALPDCFKLTAATGTTERIFIVAFAVGDFNEDGRLDLVVQTGAPLSVDLFKPLTAQVFIQDTNGSFVEKAEY